MPIRRYFGRRQMRTFDLRPPVYSGREDTELIRPDDPPPSTEVIKTVLWLIYTWDQAKPSDFSNLESVFVNKGYNWSTWIDALTTRINARGGSVSKEIIGYDADDKETTIEAAVKLQFKGESCIDLASMADYAVLGAHHPPSQHAKAIVDRSQQPDGTKIVLGLFNFESDNQARPWNDDLYTTVWNSNRDSIMYSETANSYGCSVVDRHELEDPPTYCPPVEGPVSPGTKHTYLQDIGYVSPPPASVPHHDAWMDALNWFLEQEGYIVQGGARPSPETVEYFLHHILVDNVMEWVYTGQATNDPPAWYTHSYIRDAWQQLFARVILDYAPLGHSGILWGNATSKSSVYSAAELSGRFIEFAFRRTQGGLRPATWPEIRAQIDDFRANELIGVLGDLGPPANDYSRIEWFTGTGPGKIGGQDLGTWQQVIDYIKSQGVTDSVFVNCCRTTAGGYLFHQPGFRLPVA